MDAPLANIRAIQNTGRITEALPKRDGRQGTRRQFESELAHEDPDSPSRPAAPDAPPPVERRPPSADGSRLDYRA